jgi:ADP-heptose:LPS heptosyltransferase
VNDPISSVAPRRVQVLRALHLGDLLVAIPSFRALRRAWPDARIELIGLPWAHALIERLPGYLDALVEFPGWPGVPERDVDASRIAAFLAQASADPPDVAIQLHGSGTTTNTFVALLGAPRSGGQVVPGQFAPETGVYVPFDAGRSELRNALSVVEALGVPPAGEEIEVLVLDEDRAEVTNGPAGPLTPGAYAVVHPGSSTPLRRWPAERFAAVADVLTDLPVVVTGTDRERDVTERMRSSMRRPSIDLTGRTSLGGLFAVIEGAAIVVTNDTGAAHVADAVGTPSVAVFTTPDPERWRPRDLDLHRVVASSSGPASVDAVRAEALDLLSAGVVAAP